MPTKHISAEKMEVGSKGGGKHWTRAEVNARKRAAEGVKRSESVKLKAPKWLSEEARKVWNKVKRQVAGLELLDNLDEEMLAIYCDLVARYSTQREALSKFDPEESLKEREEKVKALDSTARLVAQYADKLGLNPTSRARLVKKRADEILDEFGNEFD